MITINLNTLTIREKGVNPRGEKFNVTRQLKGNNVLSGKALLSEYCQWIINRKIVFSKKSAVTF